MVNAMPDLDLGIQKGLQRAYGLRAMPKPKDVLRHGAKWAPYRSIAAWYLWRLLDTGDVERVGATKKKAAPERVKRTGKAAPRKAAKRSR